MSPLTHRHRRTAALVPALVLVAALGACGEGSDSTMPGAGSSSAATHSHHMSMPAPTYAPITPGPAATGPHNDADVVFASGMVPHHGQAVVMADMILSRTQNAKVRTLAEAIKAAQTPEIVTMSGWLKGWGEDVPDPWAHAGGMGMGSGSATDGPMESMDGMDHGSMDHGSMDGMGGMMSPEQMGRLAASMGPAADAAFLSMMIEHHQGAIAMARDELANGANPDTSALAQAVVKDQSAEITTMRDLLASLG
ncbi:MAG: DUF305 domain-containing protein [Kineosporiaceae bacterium]